MSYRSDYAHDLGYPDYSLRFEDGESIGPLLGFVLNACKATACLGPETRSRHLIHFHTQRGQKDPTSAIALKP